MEFDGIIFDLDGTLWDSTDVLARAWSSVISSTKSAYSIVTKEEVQSCMGLNIQEIIRKLFSKLDEGTKRILVDKIRIAQKEFLSREGGILYENLEDTLKLLYKNYPLFIVSNCQSDYIETFLKYHKLEKYFNDIECEGNTGFSKDKNIVLLKERNKLKKPIYIGDTQGDLKAAVFAEVTFIYAEYGFGIVSDYDYSIKSISELTGLLLS